MLREQSVHLVDHEELHMPQREARREVEVVDQAAWRGYQDVSAAGSADAVHGAGADEAGLLGDERALSV